MTENTSSDYRWLVRMIQLGQTVKIRNVWRWTRFEITDIHLSTTLHTLG